MRVAAIVFLFLGSNYDLLSQYRYQTFYAEDMVRVHSKE